MRINHAHQTLVSTYDVPSTINVAFVRIWDSISRFFIEYVIEYVISYAYMGNFDTIFV